MVTDPNSCDLLIQRATLFDGAGGPPTVGDLAVTGDKILVIGDLGTGARARRWMRRAWRWRRASSTCTPMTTARC